MIIDTNQPELRSLIPAGTRFKFGPDRFQLHTLIALTAGTIVYRDPQDRLQETPHREVFAILPKWDQNQNGIIDDALELAMFAEHSDHGRDDQKVEIDPVCYCGELKSQHKGWNQDHGFVASPENDEDEDEDEDLDPTDYVVRADTRNARLRGLAERDQK